MEQNLGEWLAYWQRSVFCFSNLRINSTVLLDRHRHLQSLTVQSVTVGHFTLPITSLLIYVESQSWRATNLLHTSFSAPEQMPKKHMLIIDTRTGSKRNHANLPLAFVSLPISKSFFNIYNIIKITARLIISILQTADVGK